MTRPTSPFAPPPPKRVNDAELILLGTDDEIRQAAMDPDREKLTTAEAMKRMEEMARVIREANL